MYKQLFLTLFLLIFCTPSWSETLTMDDLVKRDGVYYKRFTKVPFTGFIHDNENKGRIIEGKKKRTWRYKYIGIGNYKEVDYKDGKRHGLYKIYKNNKLEKKVNYKDGKQHGLYEIYHKNGELYQKGEYNQNKKTRFDTFSFKEYT